MNPYITLTEAREAGYTFEEAVIATGLSAFDIRAHSFRHGWTWKHSTSAFRITLMTLQEHYADAAKRMGLA